MHGTAMDAAVIENQKQEHSGTVISGCQVGEG